MTFRNLTTDYEIMLFGNYVIYTRNYSMTMPYLEARELLPGFAKSN